MNIAVIGCGNIGRRHLAVIEEVGLGKLVAICDTDEDVCKDCSELYSDIPYYTTLDQLLTNSNIDLLIVSTPHATHYEISIAALNAGCNVLVEKPMALKSEHGEEMIACAKANGKKLFVVKQNRYNVPVKLVQEAFNQNKLGKIHLVQCNVLWNRNIKYYTDSNWRGKLTTEGGALFTQASHFIDLLVNWFGDIHSASTNLKHSTKEIEIEDLGSSIIQFKNDVSCVLNWTTKVYSKNYEGSITIIAEKGTIKIGGRYLNKIEYWDVESFPLQEGVEFIDKPNVYQKYQGSSSNHDQVLKNVLAILNNQKNDNVVEGMEGLKTVRAIEKIYSSARS